MPDYAQMTQLTKVSVELEDCFGVGIYRFLRMVGHQLTELSLSCSSGKLIFLEWVIRQINTMKFIKHVTNRISSIKPIQ